MMQLDKWPNTIHEDCVFGFPELLTTTTLLSAFASLIGNISLILEKDLHWLEHVDLVIAGWPCQGMSMAGNQNGFQDGCS
jgi:hypothetical protein